MKKRLLTFLGLLVVFFCSSFNVFASSAVTPTHIYNGHFTFLDGDVTVDYNTVIYDSTIIDHDYDFDNGRTYYGTSSQPYPGSPYNWWAEGHSNLYDVTVHHTLTFRNYGDYLAYANPYISFVPDMTFESGYYPLGCSVDVLTDDFTLYTVYNGQFRFICSNPDYQYQGRFAIPKDGQVSFSFDIHYVYYYENGSINNGNTTSHGAIPGNDVILMNSGSFVYPDGFTFSNVDSSANNIVNMWRIDQWLSIISNKLANSNQAYNNSDVQQSSSDIAQSSNDLDTELGNVHTQEQQWYSDNEAAIQATGLSNYQFSSSQISGLTAIRTQFSDVWDSLGDWNLVYIFTLLLSFATFILRHRPTTKAQQRMKLNDQNRVLQRKYYLERTNQNQGTGDLMQMALRKYAK